MKTALRGSAAKDGSVQPNPIASSPPASTCEVCGGAHETSALIRFMRGVAAFAAEWREAVEP